MRYTHAETSPSAARVAVPVVRHLAAEILEPLAKAARRTDAASIAAE